MSEQPPRQLSAEEIVVLKFAAHRQLARWARKSELSPRQRVKRTALRRAARTLEDTALMHGCELRVARDR
jgi:uncharacterized Rossmann fold enzyme